MNEREHLINYASHVDVIDSQDEYWFGKESDNDYKAVDEHLQALEIIVNKGVNVKHFIEELDWDKFDYEFYLCNFRHYSIEELTKAEFDFVLKVVKEILKNAD